MTDIVNDLRTALAERQKVMKGGGELYRRAADEIERLRDVNDQTTAALEAAEQRAEEAERLAEVRRETIREYERENEAWSVRAHTAERERDQYAAVVEKARAARAKHPVCEKHPDGDPISCGWKGAVLDIDAALATSPADALREVKAAAWDEGVNAEAHAAVTTSPRIKNPYRAQEEER